MCFYYGVQLAPTKSLSRGNNRGYLLLTDERHENPSHRKAVVEENSKHTRCKISDTSFLRILRCQSRSRNLILNLLTLILFYSINNSSFQDQFPQVDAAYIESPQNNSILGQLWTMTRGAPISIIEPKVEKEEKKKVRFQTSVRVILIPSRPEYIAAGLLPVLWWEKSDFPLFKTAAVSEVISLMQLQNIKNCKEAMKMLYQAETAPCMDGNSSESDMDCSDSDTARTSTEKLDELSGEASSESPKSCLKHQNADQKTAKRPISCLAKEDRYNHIQRHLHPLAYMCD